MSDNDQFVEVEIEDGVVVISALDHGTYLSSLSFDTATARGIAQQILDAARTIEGEGKS